MADPQTGQGMPDPGEFFAAFAAYQKTGAFKGAIELDLFTRIGADGCTAAELARRCEASPRGIRILADYLVSVGALTKDGHDATARYGLTPSAATFLDRSSPAFMGSAIDFLCTPVLVEGFMNVAAAVRKGGTVSPDDGVLAPDAELWVRFARAMAPAATFVARLLAMQLDAAAAPRWKVLDVAAGHGMYGIILAGENPNAEIVALDWPNVLRVAEENARAAGVQDRFRTIGGSAFEAELGSGYDLVLLPNILHHFDVAGCEMLLRRVRAALAPGGRVVTVEFIPNDDRTSPVIPASFGIVMLVGTPAGDMYTYAELERMARNAGFARSELLALPPSFQSAVISYTA